MLPGAGLAVTPPTPNQMVAKLGEVLRCVEGCMCMLKNYSDLEFFACLNVTLDLGRRVF